jgi:hypothetical protein
MTYSPGLSFRILCFVLLHFYYLPVAAVTAVAVAVAEALDQLPLHLQSRMTQTQVAGSSLLRT